MTDEEIKAWLDSRIEKYPLNEYLRAVREKIFATPDQSKLVQLDLKLAELKAVTLALTRAQRDAALPLRHEKLLSAYRAEQEAHSRLIVEKKTKDDMIRLGVIPPFSIEVPFLSRLHFLFTGRF